MTEKRGMRAAHILATAAAVAALTAPTLALAHHAMGGGTPTTLGQGLLSGLAHPVLGADHLAFLLGTGILMALSGRWMWLPVAFLVGLVPGVLAHVAGFGLGANEMLVALSVVALGLALLLEERIASGLLALAMLVAGFLHGYAFGESGGASAAPVVGYLVGLAMMVMTVTSVVAWGTRKMASAPVLQRVAAGLLVAVGTVFAFQNLAG